MRKLIWSPKAREDAREILAFIGARNPQAAVKLMGVIEHAADQLPRHPYLYRPGRVEGTREAVVHPNYILIYEVHETAINIRTVIHARRQYP